MQQSYESNGLVDVDAQLVRLLYRNAPTGLLVNVAVAILLCWVLSPTVSWSILLLWLLAVLMVTVLRLYNYLRFQRAAPTDESITPWRLSFLSCSACSALAWGLTPWLFGPFEDILTPMILAFALGGLMAGAAAILGAVLLIYIVYAVIIMGPITLWFILQTKPLDSGLGLMLLVAMFALAANSMIYRRVLRDSIELSNALYLAKREAEAANQAKAQFLSRMSHELRTPLSSILGFAQLVQEQHARGSQHWIYLEKIVDATDHLLALIDDLLDLARIETHTVELEIGTVSCAELIDECLHHITPFADECRVTLYRLQEDESLTVLGDESRLRQVLLNLLTNACANNRPGGRVGVGADRAGANQVCLYVDDLSHSIPEAWHDQMFLSYHRLGRDQSAVEGTGLGLMISQQLVELMNGRVEVTQTGPSNEFGIPRFALLLPGETAESDDTLSYGEPQPRGTSTEEL